MSEAARRVSQAARDASSNDDLVRDEMESMVWDGDMLVPRPPDFPLDEETLDEQASTQMGDMYESRRRDAN
jgi:hypothetical protein